MTVTSIHALVAAARAETEALFSLDARPDGEALPGPEYRARRRRITWLRRSAQVASLALILLIGARFVGWVRALETGAELGYRPPGVEGFLPISGLLALRHLAETGEVSTVHPAALSILMVVIAGSLLLKKAFCSWLCPIGTLSEALAGLGRRMLRRRFYLPRFLDWPLRSLKYLLFAFFAHAVFVAMSPGEVASFLASPYNQVADIKMLQFFQHLSPLALKVLLGLAGLSLVIPFFWCRYLCPYGALLGGISLLSPFKVARRAPSCIDCGKCSRACPAHLPVERLGRVRSDECVGCLSCVAACPVPQALQIEGPRPWRRTLRPAFFGALLLAVFGGGLLIARATGNWHSSVTADEYRQHIHRLGSYDHLRDGAVETSSAADPRVR